MVLVGSPLKMEIDIKANSTMDYFMVKANLYGQMEFNIKDNLQIIESLDTVSTNGPIAVYIKAK